MNTENIRRTIEAIEAHPAWYDQGEWYRANSTNCSTPACVAVLPIRDYAAELLGLTAQQADQMFDSAPDSAIPPWAEFYPTAAEAVAMLKEAAATGQVIWRATDKRRGI